VKSLHRWGILAVLLVAAALRLWQLPDLPVGLHYDEAANVILTREIAAGTYTPLFIRAYTGKEVLFFYAAAPWVRLLGGAAWGLRLGAAMLGTLTVAATYAAARALLGAERRRIALLAAAWMAIAFPHLLLSRYGFRAISQPLLQALTLATLWRGLRVERVRWLVTAGLLLGLTGYTYLAARLFPIPLALALGWLVWREPRRVRPVLLVLAVAALTFAPLGAYFLQHPDAFFTRIDQVAAPTWGDAWQGFTLCLRALGLPGAGEFYVRFNIPGQPLLDPLSAGLALLGLAILILQRRRAALDAAARILVLLALPVMLLPSALATAEITPSNLRMVGLYPFLPLLPALGAAALLDQIPQRARRSAYAATLAVLLLLGGGASGRAYLRWANSAALFETTDGAMALAAQALDSGALTQTTVYIASEHYRHPTVAALAEHYGAAKWLTGGATLVLPSTGDARYLWPAALQPPAPWPVALDSSSASRAYAGPDQQPALWEYTLSEAALAELRLSGSPAANFAHIVAVQDSRALQPCQAGDACPILSQWDIIASYPTLQPVVRIVHPLTGEWSRSTVFHYPTSEWAIGEQVWDQLTPVLPATMPPVAGYQIGLSFFNPDTGEVLPRLDAEGQFAGLEAVFPLGEVLPAARPPSDTTCGAPASQLPPDAYGLRLASWRALPGGVTPGERLPLTLCWRASEGPLPERELRLVLRGPQEVTLYAGASVQGLYPFSAWAAGQVVEDRYQLRLPRTLPPGGYEMLVWVGETPVANLGSLEVRGLERDFAPPAPDYPQQTDFGGQVRLLGYDLHTEEQALTVNLYWQALAELDEDYTVFVHLLDAAGQIVAQVDAGPRGGTYPTSWWLPGEIIRDAYTLHAPPGDYTLRVGFYLQATGAHLQVAGEDGVLLPGARIGD